MVNIPSVAEEHSNNEEEGVCRDRSEMFDNVE